MIEHQDIPQNLPDWARPEGYQIEPAPPVSPSDGLQPAPQTKATSTAEPASATGLDERKEEMLEALKDVVDPELMVNVVDLGLVYDIDIDDENNVTIDMTLTSPACPLTDQIEMGVQDALQGLADSVTVNWVWLPAWSLECITPDGREQLRYIGYNI